MQLPPNVSQRDIAHHLNISVSTVSRALSGSGRVSALTRNAVQRAIGELAAAQRQSESAMPVMIGITHSHSADGVLNHNNESVLDQVLGGVEEACRAHDVVPYPWQQSHLLASNESIPFFSRVSGVIMSGGEVDHDVVDSIRANGKSIVIIGGHLPDTGIPSVAADSFMGIYLATQHLLKLGHRRISLVNGPNTTYTSREKKAGYLTALADAGVPFDPGLLVARDDRTGLTDEAAETLTRALFERDQRPTALIFAMDTMARAGYRVCQDLGLSIPDDISIVGFHDDDAAFAYPPLSSVRVNRHDWGVAAVDVLMRVISGECQDRSRLLLPVEFVERSSTGPPSTAMDMVRTISHEVQTNE
jgi:LacI family transcriptional regulator